MYLKINWSSFTRKLNKQPAGVPKGTTYKPRGSACVIQAENLMVNLFFFNLHQMSEGKTKKVNTYTVV